MTEYLGRISVIKPKSFCDAGQFSSHCIPTEGRAISGTHAEQYQDRFRFLVMYKHGEMSHEFGDGRELRHRAINGTSQALTGRDDAGRVIPPDRDALFIRQN